MSWYIAKENKKVVCHDFINQTMGLDSVYHEWFFINALLEEVKLDEKMVYYFIQFVMQYYPDYLWTTFNPFDLLSTLLIEISIHNMHFKYFYSNLGDRESIDRAMEFGHMVTEFLIRFRDYSLVRSCGQNVILTSRYDCDKYFLPYLLDGYTLFRYAKVHITSIRAYSETLNYFTKRPVFPTKELYAGKEFIEAPDGNFVLIPNYNRSRGCKY